MSSALRVVKGEENKIPVIDKGRRPQLLNEF